MTVDMGLDGKHPTLPKFEQRLPDMGQCRFIPELRNFTAQLLDLQSRNIGHGISLHV